MSERLSLRPICAGLFAALLCPAAVAFEAENGVPLAITAEIGPLAIERLAVRLHGRDVTIRTELLNDSGERQVAAFYASTPLFGQLGIAEEYADKSFRDLRVTIDGARAALQSYPKAYFRGRDITSLVRKAGVDPLPHPDSDQRKLRRLGSVDGAQPSDWRGSVTYAWKATLAKGARSVHEVRFRALPRFALEMVDSDRLTRQVAQFCGDPARVRRLLAQADPQASAVMVERYDIPVDYLAMREATVDVTQPDKNWLGARPVATLACGLGDPAGGATITGTIDGPDQVLSVLVISMLEQPEAPATGEQHGR